jgi:hypothetical protein
MKLPPFFWSHFCRDWIWIRNTSIYLFTVFILFLVGSKTFALQVLNLSGLSIPGATEGNGPLEVSSCVLSCLCFSSFFSL